MGIGENLYVGGIVNITNDETSDSTYTGALIVAGGVGIGENLYVGGVISITSDESSTAVDEGSLVVTGGIGVSENLYVGGIVNITSDETSDAVDKGSLVVTGGIGVSENLYVGGITNITSIDISDSTYTGALIVAGGVGIGENLNVGGNIDAASFTILGENAGIITSQSGLRPVGSTATTFVTNINPALYGQYNITFLSSDLLITLSSAEFDGQRLIIRIQDNGTSQNLSYDPAWIREIGLALPTYTIPDQLLYIALIYNEENDVWDVLSYVQQ